MVDLERIEVWQNQGKTGVRTSLRVETRIASALHFAQWECRFRSKFPVQDDGVP